MVARSGEQQQFSPETHFTVILSLTGYSIDVIPTAARPGLTKYQLISPGWTAVHLVYRLVSRALTHGTGCRAVTISSTVCLSTSQQVITSYQDDRHQVPNYLQDPYI